MALSTGYGLVPDDWQADPVRCILARKKDGRWAASQVKITVPRQNGKNGILEVVELFFMVVLGLKILHTAHEVKTARKAFLRLCSFFENERQFPELAALVSDIRKTNGQEAILLKCRACQGDGSPKCAASHGGASIEFIARSKGSGRGFTVDVLVCDEDQDLTDDELAALLPTISAAPSGQSMTILTGTPPDPEKPEEAKGEVARRVRKLAIDRADKSVLCMDWGVEDGPLPDVDDEALWHRCNPALGGRLSLVAVRRERSMMSPEKFARERLGWWGDPKRAAGGVFGAGAWPACGVDVQTPPPVAAIGIGVSLDAEWASIGSVGWWPNGHPLLGATAREAGTDWLPAEAMRIQDTYGVPVLVDEKCPDPNLVQALRDHGVDVTAMTTADRISADSDLKKRVKARTATHARTPELDAAVAAAAWRKVGDRKMLGRSQSSADISMLEAVSNALWGAENAAAYDVLDSIG